MTRMRGGEAGICLARGLGQPGGPWVLRHVNDGPADQHVILSAGPLVPGSPGRFGLRVRIADPSPNDSCEFARRLLRVSRDGGGTFGDPVMLDTRVSDAVAAGPSTFFATANGLPGMLVIGRDGGMPRQVTGLFPLTTTTRGLVADHLDNAVVLDQDGTLVLRRLPAGATEFLPGRLLGASRLASAVPLSDTAIAVISTTPYHGVRVSVETWP
jgi:hypothetical protein